MVAAPEAAARPVPPVAPKTMPAVGRSKGVMTQGPSSTMVAAEETSKVLSLALPSKGCHPPTWDAPPFRWVSLWDLLSELFTLDDAAKGMEREKLHNGFMAMLEALN